MQLTDCFYHLIALLIWDFLHTLKKILRKKNLEQKVHVDTKVHRW